MGKIQKFYYDGKDRDQWLELRQEVAGKNSTDSHRVGASDTAAVCGYSKYKAPLNCYFEALGMIDNRIESLRMSLGLVSEATNKLCYETYSADEQVFAVQLKNYQRVNKINNVNYIAVNEDFPYIYCTLDFNRPKGQPALVDSSMYAAGETVPHAYPVDGKNINFQYWAASGKSSPKNYLYQMQSQMIACGVKYSELGIKIEDSDYVIQPVVWDDYMVDTIKARVSDFCQRVVKAKPLAKLWIQAKAEGDYEGMAIYEDLIGNLQPDVIGIDAEIEALEGMYLAPIDSSLIADDSCMHHYHRYKKARRVEGIADKVKKIAKSYLVNYMGDYKTLDCGDKQKVVHYLTSKDKFYFSVK